MRDLALLTPEPALGPVGLALTPAAILSVATALPDGRVTSAELAERLGVSEDWIVSRTGIRERRQARPHERLSDFATRAGSRALEAAGVEAANLDLVIVATLSQDEVTPNTAPIVAHELGATGAGAFDVGAACTAFLTALAQGSANIESGRAQHVLVIGADFVTRLVDYSDRRSAPLFADAAGAVVLGPGDAARGSIGPIVLGADGSHAGTLFATVAERKIRMDG
ncbi:MAG: 3-oxoacyl-ACP synthase III family protein, partial [Solirubrobacteraceae bacterium]